MKKFIALALLILALGTPKASAFNPLEALSGIVNNLTSTSSFELSQLEGTWKYSSPAVTFQSDNALSSLGGAAASTTIENKLSSYYKKLGLNNAVLTIDSSANFTLKFKKMTLNGTITKNDDNGSLTFNFTAASAFSLGQVSAMASLSSAGVLTLTFDASRVISVMQTVAQYSNNTTLSTVTSLLGSYDGIYAGAKLKKK